MNQVANKKSVAIRGELIAAAARQEYEERTGRACLDAGSLDAATIARLLAPAETPLPRLRRMAFFSQFLAEEVTRRDAPFRAALAARLAKGAV